jgi:hypothetical protein
MLYMFSQVNKHNRQRSEADMFRLIPVLSGRFKQEVWGSHSSAVDDDSHILGYVDL